MVHTSTWLLLGCLLWPGVVWAGSAVFTFGGTPLTLTTTAPQDAFLNRLLVKENALRASRVPPAVPLTLEQYMRDIFVTQLQELKRSSDTHETVDFCTAYNALTAPQKAGIMTLGGGNNPCP